MSIDLTTFKNGQVADAKEVNKNFTEIKTATENIQADYVTTDLEDHTFSENFTESAKDKGLLDSSGNLLSQTTEWNFPIISGSGGATVFSISGNNLTWTSHNINFQGRAWTVQSSAALAPTPGDSTVWNDAKEDQVAVYIDIDKGSIPATGSAITYKYQWLGDLGDEALSLTHPSGDNTERFYIAIRTGGGTYMTFDAGKAKPAVGAEIVGVTSGAKAKFQRISDMTNDNWTGSLAAGRLYYKELTDGPFVADEKINITGGTAEAFDVVAPATVSSQRVSSFNSSQLLHGSSILSGSITSGEIASDSITANNIKSGTIETGNLSFTPATASNIISTITTSTEGIKIKADSINLDATDGVFTKAFTVSNSITLGGSGAIVTSGKTWGDEENGVFLGHTPAVADVGPAGYAFEVYGVGKDPAKAAYLRFNSGAYGDPLVSGQIEFNGELVGTTNLSENSTSNIVRFTDTASGEDLPFMLFYNGGDNDGAVEPATLPVVDDVLVMQSVAPNIGPESSDAGTNFGKGIVKSVTITDNAWATKNAKGFIVFKKISGDFGYKNQAYMLGSERACQQQNNNTSYGISCFPDPSSPGDNLPDLADPEVGKFWTKVSRSHFSFTPKNTGVSTVTVRFRYRCDANVGLYSVRVTNKEDDDYAVFDSGLLRTVSSSYGDGTSEYPSFSFDLATTKDTEAQLELWLGSSKADTGCDTIQWEADEHYR